MVPMVIRKVSAHVWKDNKQFMRRVMKAQRAAGEAEKIRSNQQFAAAKADESRYPEYRKERAFLCCRR